MAKYYRTVDFAGPKIPEFYSCPRRIYFKRFAEHDSRELPSDAARCERSSEKLFHGRFANHSRIP